jgi:hypothetical protein
MTSTTAKATVETVAAALERGDFQAAKAAIAAWFDGLTPEMAAEMRAASRAPHDAAVSAHRAIVDRARTERGLSAHVMTAQRAADLWGQLWSGSARVASKAGL